MNIRSVPFTTTMCIHFGGGKSRIGWLFVGFGLIFVWLFLLNADLSFTKADDRSEHTQGVITSVAATGSKRNNERIYAFRYTFKTPEGRMHEGVSYESRRTLKAGDNATIEYSAAAPANSSITGMRNAEFGPEALFALIFPAVGLLLLAGGLKDSLRAIRLISIGEVGVGKLIEKTPTRTKINDNIVYLMKYRFKDLLGSEHDISMKTHLKELVNDESDRRLYYSTEYPNQSILFDDIPYRPQIGEGGEILASPLSDLLLRLIAPTATIIGHGIYIVNQFT